MKIYRKKLAGCEPEPLLHCAETRGIGWRSWKLQEDVRLQATSCNDCVKWHLVVMACCAQLRFPVSQRQAAQLFAWASYIRGSEVEDCPCYYCGLPALLS